MTILPASPVLHQQPQAPLIIMSSTTNPCITDGKCTSPTNIPEFIDTSACLCGLLPSKQEVPNGGYIELWRCIGNASDDLRAAANGKWYNTSLPSQELVGINQPQNWAENGPDTSQAYVVVNNSNGKSIYEKLTDAKNSPSLVGPDVDCNGKNDTQLSTRFYSHSGKNSSNAASASSSSSSMASSSMASSTASGTATAASGTMPASTAGSSTSATVSQSASGTSGAGRASVKGVFVFCMLFAPLFASIV